MVLSIAIVDLAMDIFFMENALENHCFRGRKSTQKCRTKCDGVVVPASICQSMPAKANVHLKDGY